MSNLQKQTGMTILLITHDMGIVNQMADDISIMYAGKIVEEAPSSKLLSKPAHPYTRGLLDSLPHGDGRRLEPIKGSVPHLAFLPSGCAFHPRCSNVMDACNKTIPELYPIDEDNPEQLSACLIDREEDSEK